MVYTPLFTYPSLLDLSLFSTMFSSAADRTLVIWSIYPSNDTPISDVISRSPLRGPCRGPRGLGRFVTTENRVMDRTGSSVYSET